MALRELGYETIMVNSNPETVSTDYDTSDKLYFEPLTFEDVMNIYENEQPEGVIVQMGGQTPLNLAVPLMKAGVPDPRHLAGQHRPRRGPRALPATARQARAAAAGERHRAMTVDEALAVADRIGYPVMIRPSYVLGGRAMMVAYDGDETGALRRRRLRGQPGLPGPDRPLPGPARSRSDVDVVCDGKDVYIGGVMQHVEEAGIHSGDSACATPPHTLTEDHAAARSRTPAAQIALELERAGA